MKRLLVALVAIAGAVALTAHAADGTTKHQTKGDQKALRKELLAKYDTNKDGKLDKQEKAKMTKEDKEKWAQATRKGRHTDAKPESQN